MKFLTQEKGHPGKADTVYLSRGAMLVIVN